MECDEGCPGAVEGRVSAGLSAGRTGAHLRLPTPLAITTTEVIRAIVDSSAIRSFARLLSGIVSVGLNADEFVSDM